MQTTPDRNMKRIIEELFILNIPKLPVLPEAKPDEYGYIFRLMGLAQHFADKKIAWWQRRSKAIADKVIIDTYNALKYV